MPKKKKIKPRHEIVGGLIKRVKYLIADNNAEIKSIEKKSRFFYENSLKIIEIVDRLEKMVN